MLPQRIVATKGLPREGESVKRWHDVFAKMPHLPKKNGGDDDENPEDRGLHILSYLFEYMRAPMIIILSSGKRNPELYSESHTTTKHHVRRRAEARRGVVSSAAPTAANTDSSYAGVSQISSSVSPPLA